MQAQNGADNQKEVQFYDDGQKSYFSKAHTSLLLIIFLTIVYIGANYGDFSDPLYNKKRGFVAVIVSFLFYCVIQLPDGPFMRPHPALWRLVLAVSILYELSLIFILFQTAGDARNMMKLFDPSLGQPFKERQYGNCAIYDPVANPDDPFKFFKDKLDMFIAAHFVGWFLQALILRDWLLCHIISLGFEVMEYTLMHQLPNFIECWWDHFILDILLTNSTGIYLGLRVLDYLKIKPYHWKSLRSIPSMRGKTKRLLLQFSPYNWKTYNWRPTASLHRWIITIFVIFMFLLAQVNFFYIKFALWIPESHFLCVLRTAIIYFSGAVALREIYSYVDLEDSCNRFGPQSWIFLAFIFTELLVYTKFEWELVTTPPPPAIVVSWAVFLVVLLIYTFVTFVLFPRKTERKAD